MDPESFLVRALPISLGFIAVFVPVFIVMGMIQPARTCPRCRAKLPRLRMPRNANEALHGGWTCHACGAEVSRFGTLKE